MKYYKIKNELTVYYKRCKVIQILISRFLCLAMLTYFGIILYSIDSIDGHVDMSPESIYIISAITAVILYFCL
ncbi:hypothetical protein M2092_000681 [Fusobacterium sp. PH5-44]